MDYWNKCEKCWGELNTAYVCVSCGHHQPPIRITTSDNTREYSNAADRLGAKQENKQEAVRQVRLGELDAPQRVEG